LRETWNSAISTYNSSKVKLKCGFKINYLLRIGAAHAVLEICGPVNEEQKRIHQNASIEYIVDCTLGYHKGIVPHFGKCLFGLWPSEESMVVAVHYKIHKVDPEWRTNSGKFKNWIYEQYKKKVHKNGINKH